MAKLKYELPGKYTMFYDVVQEDRDLTNVEKKVYCHIIRRSQLTGYCFEGNAVMADFLGLSYEYVKDILRMLRRKKYIRSQGRGGGRRIYPMKLYDGNINEWGTIPPSL